MWLQPVSKFVRTDVRSASRTSPIGIGTPIVLRADPGPARISAPRASGSGRVRIKPLKIRSGDRFAARVPLRAAALRRARRQRVPTLRAGKLRVTARAQGPSNAELTRLLLSLQAQVESGTAALGTTVTSLQSDLGGVEGSLSSLQGQGGALEGELDSLTQDVADLCGALPLVC